MVWKKRFIYLTVVAVPPALSIAFDAVAEKMLNEDKELKTAFDKKKLEDKDFAADSFAQLYFIYKKSAFFEDLKRYPVGRIMWSKWLDEVFSYLHFNVRTNAFWNIFIIIDKDISRT